MAQLGIGRQMLAEYCHRVGEAGGVGHLETDKKENRSFPREVRLQGRRRGDGERPAELVHASAASVRPNSAREGTSGSDDAALNLPSPVMTFKKPPSIRAVAPQMTCSPNWKACVSIV